jgi:hypothetical protein
MLVLDRSRALESMLWLSQRARVAVPEVLRRPATLRVAFGEGGRRVLAAPVVLQPAGAIASRTVPCINSGDVPAPGARQDVFAERFDILRRAGSGAAR